jgi:hypothetical protein
LSLKEFHAKIIGGIIKVEESKTDLLNSGTPSPYKVLGYIAVRYGAHGPYELQMLLLSEEFGIFASRESFTSNLTQVVIGRMLLKGR